MKHHPRPDMPVLWQCRCRLPDPKRVGGSFLIFLSVVWSIRQSASIGIGLSQPAEPQHQQQQIISVGGNSESSHENGFLARDLPAMCSSINSEKWKNASRYRNIDIHATDVERMIVDDPISVALSLLNQSIAHPSSSFLNTAETIATDDDDKNRIRGWAIRLIYLTMYQHQHGPALNEMRVRRREASDCLGGDTTHAASGSFDFECPGAKYLAVSVWHNGIGANLNHIVVPALMAGLATNRVVLLVNHVGQRAVMKVPWQLASCPRRDWQCFFAPPTPCTPTVAELEAATQLKKNDKRTLFRTGQLPKGHENEKVLYMLGLHKTDSLHFGGYFLKNFRHKAQELVNTSSVSEEIRASLLHALDTVSIENPDGRDGFQFSNANSQVHQALITFATRPNLGARRKLESALRSILPKKLVADNLLGLPIRASDKCIKETECMSFVHHLEASSKAWKQHAPAAEKVSILFTTESRDMVRQQTEFKASSPYSLNFLTNSNDVLPDSGRIASNANFTADEAMLSSFVTIQLQLLARVTVGNCCSNFHALIHHFLSAGLGASPVNTFHCLQDDDDPLYRPCCWKGKCSESRKQAISERENQTTANLRWLAS